MLPKDLAEVREHSFDDLSEAETVLKGDEFSVERIRTATDQISLDEDGILSVEGRQLHYVQGVHEDLAKLIKMPLPFAYDLDFDLFNLNFEALKKQRSKGITLCTTRGDTVVGVASADYSPASTLDVLDRLQLDEDWIRCQRVVVSDFGVALNLIVPGVSIEPEEGDVINIGLRLSNSETGGKELQATLFTERLVCTNGSVVRANEGVVYWAKHKKRTYGSSLRAFVAGVHELKDRAQAILDNVYENVLDNTLSDEDFVSLFRTLQRRTRSADAAETILEIDPQERREIQRVVRERDRSDAPEPTRFQVFDVHNRITAAARTRQLLMRQHLEEIGGSLLFSRN